MLLRTAAKSLAILGIICAVEMSVVTTAFFYYADHYIKLFPNVLQLISALGDEVEVFDVKTGAAKVALRDGGELTFKCGENLLRGKIIEIIRDRNPSGD